MNKNNRKEIIEHFIKWNIYIQDDDKEQEEIMLDILDNYIDNKHYNFNPFTEIKEKK